MVAVYYVGGADDDRETAHQGRDAPIRVSWRDQHGADQVYVFRDEAELRARVAALARPN